MVFHLQGGAGFQQLQVFRKDSDMKLHGHHVEFDPIEFECNQDRFELPRALIASFAN
jgi:hypothetical protein